MSAAPEGGAGLAPATSRVSAYRAVARGPLGRSQRAPRRVAARPSGDSVRPCPATGILTVVRGGLPSLLVLAAVLGASASAAATPASQARICQAVAAANHLKVAGECPTTPVDVVSFTVPAKAPAGFKATVGYSIIDTSADAQAAWVEDDPGPGPETTLPNVGRVPGLRGATYLYLAPGQDDAEATALVGTVIVDVIIVPLASNGTTSLKPAIEATLSGAVGLVRTAASKAAG
jgi:hypothetical protein